MNSKFVVFLKKNFRTHTKTIRCPWYWLISTMTWPRYLLCKHCRRTSRPRRRPSFGRRLNGLAASSTWPAFPGPFVAIGSSDVHEPFWLINLWLAKKKRNFESYAMQAWKFKKKKICIFQEILLNLSYLGGFKIPNFKSRF